MKFLTATSYILLLIAFMPVYFAGAVLFLLGGWILNIGSMIMQDVDKSLHNEEIGN